MAQRNEKRARKKAARDAELEARMAAYRRQRMARLITVLVVLGALVAAAFLLNDDETAPPTAGDDEPAVEVACGAEAPPAADPQQYDAPPEMALEDGVDYGAVIHTSCGDIEVDLLEETAPTTVNNFVFLAQEGYYDGNTWHRIEQNFVIQAGDPDGQNGQEPDGPGYAIEDELPQRDREYVYGVVAMANSGPNTGGSQFFVVVHDFPGAEAGKPEPAGLDTAYSIFGMVDESSWEAVQSIATQPVKGGQDQVESVKPAATVYIESIEIVER